MISAFPSQIEIQWCIQSQISFTIINIFLDVMPCGLIRLLPSSWQKSFLLPWIWQTTKSVRSQSTVICIVTIFKDLKSCKPKNQKMQHLMATLTWGITAEAVRKHIHRCKLSLACFHLHVNAHAHYDLHYFKMCDFCSLVKTEKLLTISLQMLCIISTRTQP